jgi:osmotically-inducible protein OsmY
MNWTKRVVSLALRCTAIAASLLYCAGSVAGQGSGFAHKTNGDANFSPATGRDRALANKIRHSLLRDRSLSSYAHNVKVVVHNGIVTLSGAVRSRDEKVAVELKASDVAGTRKVQSLLKAKS